MVERDDGILEIIKQCGELVVEQWQPVLHALVLATGRNALIERIVDVDTAEGFGKIDAELADRGLVQQHLIGRIKCEALQCRSRALRLRVEAPDRLQRIAEEIEPDRGIGARREDVDDAATHREVAGVHDRAGPRKAVFGQIGNELVGFHPIARRSRKPLPFDEGARYDALQDGWNGSEQQGRLGQWLQQAGQCGEPTGDDVRHWRDAVIGQAVPGGKAQDIKLGCKIGKLIRQHGGALVIDGNVNDHPLARCLGDFRQQHRVEPLGHAGNGNAAGLGQPLFQFRKVDHGV